MVLRMAWLPFAVAAQALLLTTAWGMGAVRASALALGLMSALTLYLLWALFRHLRAVDDTPTSRTASAAQGYVEFFGKAERDPASGDAPLRSRLTGLPCLWFEYLVEQRRGERWHRIDQGRSDARFVLRDESGTCVIDPHGAEVLPRRRDRWTKGEYRHTEAMLLEGDALYALGQLATEGGAANAPGHSALTNQLLSQWKRDQSSLLARFDLDGNRKLDTREWELARTAARREAASQHRALGAMQGRPCLRRPDDGRPFLISNRPPDELARRYRRWFQIQGLMLITSIVSWAVLLHGLGVE